MQHAVAAGSPNLFLPFVRTMSSYARLDAADLANLAGIVGEAHTYGAHRELPASGTQTRLLAIASGWIGNVTLLEDGRRQIIDLMLPGDLLDPVEVAQLGLLSQALTSARLHDVSRLHGLMAAQGPDSALAQAWTAHREAVEARRVRHLLRLGRMMASERVVDLLLELNLRQRRADLSRADTVSLPFTQEVLADYLGLSIVHVNRTLTQLRRERLIDYRAGRITFRDADLLAGVVGHPLRT